MKNILLVIFLFINISLFSQIDYTISMSNPKNHYFEVEMQVKKIKGNTIEVKMPVWAPGSYLVRDFSKNVNQVRAYDEFGKTLKVYKSRKNGWTIENGNAKNITVKYEVFAFELSVRTSFLDEQHGFISGTGIFMYTEQHRNSSGTLKVIPHSSFSKITTGLSQHGEGVVSDNREVIYDYSDYDVLADSPIEVGNQTVFSFTASGCLHEVAMFGKADYDIEKLKKDMAKIVDASTAVYGENPNKYYAFIIHNVTDAQGGLEHLNSTTLSVNRFTYSPENYVGFLNLVAHEYFHIWNVKRSRAINLGPFDYDNEVYTPLLYALEGFTSYYSNLITYRAGFIDENQFVSKIQNSINYVAGSEGAKVQSLSDASFDAWIKAYKPTVNSANTTVSYYTGGSMMGAIMDAVIVGETDGAKNLDDFMRSLYNKFYKEKNRGFTVAEFEQEFSNVIGKNMSSFFDQYIRGTKLPNVKSIFAKIGVNVDVVNSETVNAGVRISGDGLISYLRPNSAAEKAGLSPDDEIISINQYRVSGDEAQKFLDNMKVREKATIQYARDKVMNETIIIGEIYSKTIYRLSLDSDAGRNSLLRKFFRI